MKNYAQGKILFRDTKWLLSNMSYRGRDDQAVWVCAVGHTTWPLHCQLALWKSNEALFGFCGQRVWNLLKSTEEWRFSMEIVVWVRGECMNGWKDFETGDKMSVMNTGVGDQLAWQVRHWNSRSSSESVITGESLLKKLPQHSTWVMALRTILSTMTVYTKVCNRWVPRQLSDDHKRASRRFVRSICTVMFVKETLFSIELWQVTSPGCTIMYQVVRDNRCSGNTRRLRPTKNSRHRLPLGKSCWPYFGDVNGPILVHFQKNGSNCD